LRGGAAAEAIWRFTPPTEEARKLNHLWSVVMWSAGAATGLMLVVMFQTERVFAYVGELPVYGLLGCMVFTVVFADYVADREIRYSRQSERTFHHEETKDAKGSG
jgi:hypothetical protein